MPRIALVMLLLTVGCLPAPASMPAWEDTECPVCDFAFEAAAGMISYTSAGVETDLCPRVLGAHPLNNTVPGSVHHLEVVH